MASRESDVLPKVLICGPDTGLVGGVASFLSSLQEAIKDEVMIDYLPIGARAGQTSIRRNIQPLLDAYKIALICRKKRFSAIHLNPSFTARSLLRDSLFLIVLRILRANNVIVSFHGWEWKIAHAIDRHIVIKWLYCHIFSWPEHILVLAGEFAEWIGAQGVPTRKIIRYTTFFDDAEAKAAKETFHKRDDGQIKILYLSRVIREKGILELVSAFALIADKYPEAELIIAGSGEALEETKQRVRKLEISERTRFMGHVSGDRKWHLLYDSDVFVLPSNYGEGCPVSILEAMAAGLPVITTPVGGVPDIVRHDVNGYLVKDIRPEALAKYLSIVIEDPGLRKEFGRQNKTIAWDQYQVSMVSRTFMHMYVAGA